MPASEARLRANAANALKSTGPKTEAGKMASRANAVTHGLTARVVLPEREAAEIERRSRAFIAELNPSGEVGEALARMAATMSVRAERCVEHENAAMTERVVRASSDFVPPEGVSEEEAGRLRERLGKLALFDPSKEATLARKYEQAAQRAFFKALQELRALERAAKVARAEELDEMVAELGSISREPEPAGPFDAEAFIAAQVAAFRGGQNVDPTDLEAFGDMMDVPITAGRRR